MPAYCPTGPLPSLVPRGRAGVRADHRERGRCCPPAGCPPGTGGGEDALEGLASSRGQAPWLPLEEVGELLGAVQPRQQPYRGRNAPLFCCVPTRGEVGKLAKLFFRRPLFTLAVMTHLIATPE